MCLCIAGCSEPGGTHLVELDGVSIAVHKCPGKHTWVSQSSGGDTVEMDTTTGLEFAVKNKQLFVNGLYYCTVAKGDVIVIEKTRSGCMGTTLSLSRSIRRLLWASGNRPAGRAPPTPHNRYNPLRIAVWLGISLQT